MCQDTNLIGFSLKKKLLPDLLMRLTHSQKKNKKQLLQQYLNKFGLNPCYLSQITNWNEGWYYIIAFLQSVVSYIIVLSNLLDFLRPVKLTC